MRNGTTLVLGATGKTGRRIVPRLRLRGIPVRAASRSSETPFDWAAPDGWEAPLRGIAETTDDVAAVLGRAPRTFEDYVARAAAAGAWKP